MTQINYHHRPFPTYEIPPRNRQNTRDHNRQSCSVLLIQWPHQQLYLTNRKRPILVGIEKLREVSRKKLTEFIKKKKKNKKLNQKLTCNICTQKDLHMIYNYSEKFECFWCCVLCFTSSRIIFGFCFSFLVFSISWIGVYSFAVPLVPVISIEIFI